MNKKKQFPAPPLDFLYLSSLYKNVCHLKVLRKSSVDQWQDVSSSMEAKNKLHAFFRALGEEARILIDTAVVSKATLLKIFGHFRSRSPFYRGILNVARQPVRFMEIKGKPVLQLNSEFILQLMIDQRTVTLQPAGFLQLADNLVPSEMVLTLEQLSNSIFFAYAPHTAQDNLTDQLNFLKLGLPDWDPEREKSFKNMTGIFFTGEEVLFLKQAPLLMALAQKKYPLAERSVLARQAAPILSRFYNLRGFRRSEGSRLPRQKPQVTLVLQEEPGSSKQFYLEPKLFFNYAGQVIPADYPVPFYLTKQQLLERDLSFEKKAREALDGKGQRFRGRLNQVLALEFIFQHLPQLPSDWVIKEKLKYFKFYRQQQLSIQLVPTGSLDWFDIKFNLPGDLQKAFNHKIIQEILHKKADYLRAGGGRWIKVSEDLKQVVSTAYFAGPDLLRGKSRRLSPFQMLGAWQYFQQFDGLKLPARLKKTIRRLKDFRGLKKGIIFGNQLDHVLRDYQKEAVVWLEFLHDQNLSGALCDDMGLGKTLQTLAFLWRLKQKGELGQCMIVVPTSAIASWQMEIEKFLPDFKVLVLEGLGRKKKYSSFLEHELYILSYTVFTRDIEEIARLKINYLILDEAQFIKNPRTKRARALFALQSQRRLVLTGTPIENRLSDLWSVFNFLMPGYLGSQDYFQDIYQAEPAGLENLKAKIKPFILRRLKQTVEKQLPPKTEIPVFCDLTEEQKNIYLHTLSLVRKDIFTAVDKKGLPAARLHIFAALTKLRQICDHPGLIFQPPNPALTSGKFEAFKEQLLEILAEEHHVLVFSQFTSMLAYIRQWLEEQKISYLYLDGATQNRGELVKRFEAGGYKVFLLSLKAGGTALTLTKADYVMHFDPWWNPAVENQATDRAHRIGQDKHVFVYKFYCRGTIEEKILQLQGKKRKLFDDILQGSLNSPSQLTKEDVEEILTADF